MRIVSTVAVIAFATSGVLAGSGHAFAEEGNSAAAQICGFGPQIDVYTVAGAPAGTEASIGFGDLQHGVSETYGGAYVVTYDHGQCVSFFAKGKSTGSGAGKVTFNPFSITKKIDKSSPGLL